MLAGAVSSKAIDVVGSSWRPRLMHTPLGVGLIFLVLYGLTWSGHYTSGDGAQKVAWSKAIIERQSADIDPGPEVRYSKYPVGQSLLAIPPLALASVITNLTGVHCEAALYTLLFVLNGAAFPALVSAYLMPTYGVRRTWGTLLLLGLCSWWWPYTKLDFSEQLVTTLLFAAFLLIRSERPVAGSVVGSFTLCLRPDSVILIGLLLAWNFFRNRNAATLGWSVLAMSPAAALNVGANLLRWGTVTSVGYEGETFSTPLLEGLYGILFSAGKSIFLFSPPLVLALIGWRRFAADDTRKHESRFFMTVLVAQVLLYACWWDWSGDDSWGVRFLLPGVMLASIPLVGALDRRTWVVGIAVLGLAVQLPGVCLNGLDYILLVHQLPLYRAADGVEEARNRIDLEDIRYNPRYSQVAASWFLLREALWPSLGTAVELQRPHERTSLQQAFATAGSVRPQLDIFWAKLLMNRRTHAANAANQ